MRGFLTTAGAVALLTLATARPASALDPSEQRGLVFAQANCAMCHAIGERGRSPMHDAPPFRTLHTRYAVEDLEEPLAEGIITGHPSMPQWRLDPDQIKDFIAYLKVLER